MTDHLKPPDAARLLHDLQHSDELRQQPVAGVALYPQLALLWIVLVWNIPVACNHASADFIISSPLMSGAYRHLMPDYEAYIKRVVGME